MTREQVLVEALEGLIDGVEFGLKRYAETGDGLIAAALERAREVVEAYRRLTLEASRATSQTLDGATVEACARACEKSYRTAADGMNNLTGEGAATAARAWAARCIRALSPRGPS